MLNYTIVQIFFNKKIPLSVWKAVYCPKLMLFSEYQPSFTCGILNFAPYNGNVIDIKLKGAKGLIQNGGDFMGLFTKKEQPKGTLKKYSVLYLGGHPDNPKKIYNIDFYVTNDRFELNSAYGEKKFHSLIIPYESCKNFEIVQRQVTTAEGLLGGINSRQLNQANNIHITYSDEQQRELIVRLEMITGVTVMGQASQCAQLMDFLKAQGILDKIVKPSQQSNPNNAVGEIVKLKGLLDSGAITEEEFKVMKAKLI